MYLDIMECYHEAGGRGGGGGIQERKSVGPVFPLTPNKPQELTF